MINQSRRTLLKSLAYGAVLATGATVATSSTAWALGQTKTTGESVLPTCDISILQTQSNEKEIVSIMNFTDNVVTLDEITPVGLEHINGSLRVKLNSVKDGAIAIQPGERFTFEVEAISANLITEKDPIPNVLAGHLKISSEHSAFNGIIPVTVFDSQAV